jgi:hypothetical protein
MRIDMRTMRSSVRLVCICRRRVYLPSLTSCFKLQQTVVRTLLVCPFPGTNVESIPHMYVVSHIWLPEVYVSFLKLFRIA